MICEKCKSDLGDFDVAHACFTGAVQHPPFPIVETCEKGERDTLQARVKELEWLLDGAHKRLRNEIIRSKELEAQINSTRLGFEFTISVYESKLSTVTAQRDELFKYAAHLIDCPSNSGPLKCDCGLAELIAKIEATREAL